MTGHHIRGALRTLGEDGAALLEAALVLPILFVMIFGIVDYGVAIGLKQSVTHAAAEGARAAVGAQVTASDLSGCLSSTNCPGNTYDPLPQNNAWDRAAHDQAVASLGWIGSNISYASITPSVAACVGTAAATCVTLKISYPYNAHPIVPDVPGMGIINPTSLDATGVVQVQ